MEMIFSDIFNRSKVKVVQMAFPVSYNLSLFQIYEISSDRPKKKWGILEGLYAVPTEPY